MPLHDWSDDRGWDSIHQLWINALLYWLQDHLPPGFRAYLGSVPGMAVLTDLDGRPDVGVRTGPADGAAQAEPEAEPADALAPDFQTVALLNPDPQMAVQVYRAGQLLAAIELISPRNKDRPSSREFYRNRYLSYLWSGVHLMLVDVHRRPRNFSFVEALTAEMQCRLPAGVPPHAVSWNVGGLTPDGGRFLDGWYRALAVKAPLPAMPLTLTARRRVLVDLEQTYAEACRRAYLKEPS